MTMLHSGYRETQSETVCLKSVCSPFALAQHCYGRVLMEVFSVRYKGSQNPSFTIIVYNGKRGQIIYKHDGRADQAVSWEPSNFGAQGGNNGHRLLLTGPYRAISVDACIAIAFNRDDRCHGEILLDIEDPSTKYDEAITDVVHTCSCHDHPVVSYALLSNAVEAIVQVKLLEPRDDAIYGGIIARSNLGEVVLFKLNDENTLTTSSHQPMIIPLLRSVPAMSLTSSLQIDVDLCGHYNGKIVKDSVTFQATLNNDHVLHLGESSQVEVKITWSD